MLKIVFCSIFLLGCASKYLGVYKPSNDIAVLKKQTLDIMRKLSIPVRKNFLRDDSITIITYPSAYLTCSYGQDAIAPYFKNRGLDTNNRWYLKPKLALSQKLDSIFFKKTDTTFIVFIKAAASISHELTHYFQNNYISDDDYIKLSSKGDYEYYNISTEIEAYAVNAYYYLYFVNIDLLKKILKNKYSKDVLFKELSIASDSLQYPTTYKHLHQR